MCVSTQRIGTRARSRGWKSQKPWDIHGRKNRVIAGYSSGESLPLDRSRAKCNEFGLIRVSIKHTPTRWELISRIIIGWTWGPRLRRSSSRRRGEKFLPVSRGRAKFRDAPTLRTYRATPNCHCFPNRNRNFSNPRGCNFETGSSTTHSDLAGRHRSTI